MDSRVVTVAMDSAASKACLSNPTHVEKVNAFIKSSAAPDGILRIELYPNFDATSDENVPSGMNVIFDTAAPVDASLLSDNLFQTFAVSRVVPVDALTDADFDHVNLHEAVRQFPDNPISARVHNQHDNREIASWSPELGGEGAFAGVYSRLRDDQRTKDYFIIARGTAPLYVRDFKQRIARAKTTPTWGDLVSTDPEWNTLRGAAQEAARRNVFRNMLNVSEACGVQIMRADDVLNGAPHEDLNLAYPELAVPEWEQPTHTISACMHERQPAVAVSYGVVPMEHCFRMEDQRFFVVANPYDGVAAFTLTNQAQMTEHRGLPADTGRDAISEAQKSPPAHSNIVVWEHHDDNDKATTAAAQLDAHRKVDKTFKRSMRQMGWAPDEDHRLEHLVCVKAKVFNPALRRQ